jgi:hypothetical protein
MKLFTKYFFNFTSGKFAIVSALNIEQATIIAQAQQIEKGNTYKIKSIKDYETGKTLWSIN